MTPVASFGSDLGWTHGGHGSKPTFDKMHVLGLGSESDQQPNWTRTQLNITCHGSDCVHGGPGRWDPVPNLIKCMHLDLGSTAMDLIKTLIQHKKKKKSIYYLLLQPHKCTVKPLLSRLNFNFHLLIYKAILI